MDTSNGNPQGATGGTPAPTAQASGQPTQGQGQQAQGSAQPTGQPPYLTREEAETQWKQRESVLRDEFSRTVNSAITQRIKQAEGQGTTMNPNPAPKPDDKLHQSEVMSLRELVESERKARIAAEENQRTAVTHQEIQNLLSQEKVDPELHTVVINHLEKTGMLKHVDLGDGRKEARITVTRVRFENQPAAPAEYRLKEGIADWLKTPQGKHFIPHPVVPPKQPSNTQNNSTYRAPTNPINPSPKSIDEAVSKTMGDLESGQFNNKR